MSLVWTSYLLASCSVIVSLLLAYLHRNEIARMLNPNSEGRSQRLQSYVQVLESSLAAEQSALSGLEESLGRDPRTSRIRENLEALRMSLNELKVQERLE